MPLAPPDFRVTIRHDELVLVAWAPRLISAGPAATIFATRGRSRVAIADLTVLHQDGLATEVTATFLSGDSPRFRDALRRWAGDVGYSRLWLSDQVLALDGLTGGTAQTTCRTCGARWSDGTPQFWLHVRRAGRFPATCPLCGAHVAQWRVCQRDAAANDLHADTPMRSPACT